MVYNRKPPAAGTSCDRPVGSAAWMGATAAEMADWTRLPTKTPATAAPIMPSTTRRPMGVPCDSASAGASDPDGIGSTPVTVRRWPPYGAAGQPYRAAGQPYRAAGPAWRAARLALRSGKAPGRLLVAGDAGVAHHP